MGKKLIPVLLAIIVTLGCTVGVSACEPQALTLEQRINALPPSPLLIEIIPSSIGDTITLPVQSASPPTAD